MSTLDVIVSVFDGVTQDKSWNVTMDFQRAKQVFAKVPITFRMMSFALDQAQSRAILGDDTLDIGGPAQRFDWTLPWSGTTVTFGDTGGNFTPEVWAAVRNWTNFGGIRVFYVPKLLDSTPMPQGGALGSVGGKTLHAHGLFDPIIFVSHQENLLALKTTRSARGVLEHEIGHAFGLPDLQGKVKNLMHHAIDSGSGTELESAQIQHIRNSSLLQNRPVTPGHPAII